MKEKMQDTEEQCPWCQRRGTTVFRDADRIREWCKSCFTDIYDSDDAAKEDSHEMPIPESEAACS